MRKGNETAKLRMLSCQNNLFLIFYTHFGSGLELNKPYNLQTQ